MFKRHGESLGRDGDGEGQGEVLAEEEGEGKDAGAENEPNFRKRRNLGGNSVKLKGEKNNNLLQA